MHHILCERGRTHTDYDVVVQQFEIKIADCSDRYFGIHAGGNPIQMAWHNNGFLCIVISLCFYIYYIYDVVCNINIYMGHSQW
jgi:hypothetical protein